MARIHSPLLFEAPSRVAARQRRLELAALFGLHLVDQAKAADPAVLPLSAELMDTVHDVADKLIERAGDTVAQRELVATLPADARLVLCMWILDTGLAAKLTAAMLKRPVCALRVLNRSA